ncbi:MAG: hypothetical protein GX610_20120 [Rhodococcus sp.]|nr:hypothetical protein [Rhodococcus sp. (in: high G+C Gram-positive bacteria)]
MRSDQAKGDILAEAYRRSRGPVAYLDESYQVPDPNNPGAKTFYLFSAVVVERDAMAELRVGLRRIAGSTWWHTTAALQHAEGQRRTRDMLSFLADGFEACVIAHRIPVSVHDHTAEEARRACYRGLATDLTTEIPGEWAPVELIVLEERNTMNLRGKDKKNHNELVAEKLIPRNARLLQTSPGIERLLWLPDLVSAAYRRTITHRDHTRTLFDLISQQVRFVQPIE